MATDRRRDTRERILDAALDLFVEKSYEAASLREIAAELGISKAALYYHFPSKADILMALHLRMHAVFDPLQLPPPGVRPTSDQLLTGLREMAEAMVANRKLFALQVRNHAALDDLQRNHDPDGLHARAQREMEERMARFLNDSAIPTPLRVRVAGAIGVVLTLGMNLIEGVEFSDRELLESLDGILRDILRPLREA